MSTSSVSANTVQTPQIPWWLILLQGIFSALIGLLLIISPGVTTLVLIQFLGFYWFISGIFGLVSIFIDSSLWGWKLFAGLLGILAGLAIIQNPLWSTLIVPGTLVIILGFEGMVIGVVNLIQAFSGGGWGVGILGALSILFGLLLVANPLVGATTLVILLGILGIAGGISAIIYAFQAR
jgi:uncharacterized membrane protein HdeD (DUF308 family)